MRVLSAIALGLLGHLAAVPALAQIIPDHTLPSSSSVTPGCTNCLIEGGTERGVNLYHSFREFSVPTNGSAWFNNGTQIQNIFTRVTGASPSNIDGLLRTNGNANLFFLNPNGILFGPNARLQVGGSFFASTANRFQFADGSEFSATNPQAPPLLSINITPGLQTDVIQSGTAIANQGNLTAGQDLILEADRLDLQGQLVAGRDLTLRAQNTVQIRDSASVPFIAQATGHFTVQGNQSVDIFALNHPASGLWAGGNLVLRSQNPIIGDAHYNAVGNVSFEQLNGQPGKLLSPNDPVIRALGDVVLGGYTGSSLHIFAGGSVTIAGTVEITDADPINGIVETVTLSNGNTVNINGRTTPTLDVRAGLEPAAVGIPGLTGTGSFTAPAFITGTPSNADIFIDTIFTPADVEGFVFLSNQYRPNLNLSGDILISTLDASILVGAANGSSVVIDSRSLLGVTGTVTSSAALGTTGNGGNITMLAQTDLVLTPGAELLSRGALGGTIALTSQGILGLSAATITNDSFGNLPGATGGNINLTGQSVVLNGAVVTSNGYGQLNPGAITVTATDTAAIVNDSQVRNLILSGAIGNSSGITINAPNVSIASGSELNSSVTFGGTGRAGDVVINAPGGNVRFDGGFARSRLENGGQGEGGDIRITTGSFLATGVPGNTTGQLTSATFGNGPAGDVSINATGSVRFDGPGSDIFALVAFDRGIGNGGKIDIRGDSLVVTNGARLLSTTEGNALGNSGDVQVTANRVEVTQGGLISTQSAANYNAGNITIQAGTVGVRGGQITSNVFGGGQAGTITIGTANNPATQIELDNGLISSATAGNSRDGGNVNLFGRSLTLTNQSQIEASTSGTGRAGTIAIANADAVTLAGKSAIVSETTGTGSAGGITVSTQQLTLAEQSTVSASSNSTNPGASGGDLTVQANQIRLTGGSRISADTQGAASGGNVILQANGPDLAVQFQDNARISASTSGSGRGGTILATASDSITLDGAGQVAVETSSSGSGGNLQFATQRLRLQNGIEVSASTTGPGTGGNLEVNALDSVVIHNSELSSETEGTGRAGNVTLTTGQFTLQAGGEITTATNGAGAGGNISLRATRGIDLLDAASSLQATTGIGDAASTATQTGAAGTIRLTTPGTVNIQGATVSVSSGPTGGNAGDVVIQAGRANLGQGGQINSNTAGGGQAGSLNLAIGDRLTVQGAGTRLSASTGAGSTGAGGSINLGAAQLDLLAGAEVVASTAGSGRAGSVNLAIGDRLTVQGTETRISANTEAGSTGTGGSLNLTANRLILTEGAEISASTAGAGGAGSVTLTTNQATLSRGGRITSNTSNSGAAGDIRFNVRDTLRLTDGGTGVFASTTADSSGNGGSILAAGRRVLIENGAAIAVDSRGTGTGGSIAIQSDRLELNRQGSITAETASAQGGNINLDIRDLLVLRRNSLISATAGNAQAGGDGGNITITTPFIIGVLGENSDITANAFTGRGGRIVINTNAIFGLLFQPALTPFSDITASSQFGLSGTVILNTLNVDPNRGLAALPSGLLDPTEQVSAQCAPARSLGQPTSKFVVTGKGGLPEQPEALGKDRPLVALTELVLPNLRQSPRPAAAAPGREFLAQQSSAWIEAQGWAIAPNGTLELVKQASDYADGAIWLPSIHCQTAAPTATP